ncbi:MAG: hypothetical protein R3Y29_06665, partial [bacterium]
ETFSLRLRYLEENNKYMLSDSYYNIIEFKYKHFNSSNTYVNRILEDKHNFKKKELEIFEPLDSRWYELLLNSNRILFKKYNLEDNTMYHPATYTEGFLNSNYTNACFFQHDYFINLMSSEHESEIRRLSEKINVYITNVSKSNYVYYQRLRYSGKYKVYDIIRDELEKIRSSKISEKNI